MNVDTLLVYGTSGSGKTTQLAELARELLGLGFTGRYAYADSGDGPFGDLVSEDGPLQALDIASMCRPTAKKPKGNSPMSVLNALADGYWYKKTDKGMAFTNDVPLVDFYMFEGLFEFANLVMQDHVRGGRKIAEDVIGQFTVDLDTAGLFDEGGEAMTTPITYASGQPGRAHYGHVQRYIMTDWWPRCKSLRTKFIVVTSHEADGKDDLDSTKSVVGPAVIGQAGIGQVTQKFQDALHLTLDVVNKPNKEIDLVRKAWYVKHPQVTSTGVASNSIFWPAKLSLPIETSKEFAKKHPGGFIDLSKNSISEIVKLRLKGK